MSYIMVIHNTASPKQLQLTTFRFYSVPEPLPNNGGPNSVTTVSLLLFTAHSMPFSVPAYSLETLYISGHDNVEEVHSLIWPRTITLYPCTICPINYFGIIIISPFLS